jgi:two-component sensor histidine kinase
MSVLSDQGKALRRLGAGASTVDSGVEEGFRFAALRVGPWLGWTSIAVVLAGLAFGLHPKDFRVLVVATVAAAVVNVAVMLVPWHQWLPRRHGRLALDLWSAGLIVFVALLVTKGGSSFALLVFLSAPFIALVQTGWRRAFWLTAMAVSCVVVSTSTAMPAGATAIRLGLVAATVAVALLGARVIRREAAGRKLERALALESNHRIKNDLQTAADLLLLARPEGYAGLAFDDAASRIRSIATVHRLLTESTNDGIDGAALLRSVAASTSLPVSVDAEPAVLDPTTAQRLGIVANELLTNACRHGAPPIVLRLRASDEIRMSVDDRGAGGCATDGLGLSLVRRMVEQGLRGRFELTYRRAGGTRAEVVFPRKRR